MSRARTFGLLGAAAAVGVVVSRHRGAARGHAVPGGMLMNDALSYDRMSRLLLGSLFRSIAADVAASTPRGGRVLEVGCGPGHLSMRLAAEHGLEVTGLDLDPAMIDRARANTDGTAGAGPQRPTFVVGDVASLPFLDHSFDLVVSTMSMHHWEDPAAALVEFGRVLRPGGRALIWDLRRGAPLHPNLPDPAERLHGGPLHVVSATPWRWPWRFSLTQRIELASPGADAEAPTSA